jgi:hypothetical protein
MMAFISRPLPRALLDEQVVAALTIAFAENPDPAYLAETLRPALRQVTGKDYEVLDRSVADVTDSYGKTMVMIRDGAIGIWPGYEARPYSMLPPSRATEEARAAIASAEGEDAAPSPTSPVGKPGWAPPPPVRRASAAVEDPGASTEAG